MKQQKQAVELIEGLGINLEDFSETHPKKCKIIIKVVVIFVGSVL